MFDMSAVKNGQDVSGMIGYNIVTGQPMGGQLPIEFWTEKKKGKKLLEDGSPDFKEIEFCRITVPGFRPDITVKEVDDKVRQDFAQQYQYWKLNKEQKMPGIPVEEWPMVQGEEVTELKFRGFHTVESLAKTGESQVSVLGQWGLRLREKAIAYLEAIKDSAALAKKAEELAAVKADRDAMQAEIDELKTAIKELQLKKKKEG